eukprot:8449401-Ditylum_brightwellii.AAC.1
MMQEQCDHLDAKIIVLLGSIIHMRATTEKTDTKLSQSKINLVLISDGPHNKCQKHSNMDADPVDVMEDADALCCNRDA